MNNQPNQNTSPSSALEKLESSQNHAKKAFDTTASAAKEIAGDACSTAHSAYREGKEELSAAAKDIGHAARATCSSLAEQTAAMKDEYCEKAGELEAGIVEYVRERPLRSVGIAFGIGLLGGILFSKR